MTFPLSSRTPLWNHPPGPRWRPHWLLHPHPPPFDCSPLPGLLHPPRPIMVRPPPPLFCVRCLPVSSACTAPSSDWTPPLTRTIACLMLCLRPLSLLHDLVSRLHLLVSPMPPLPASLALGLPCRRPPPSSRDPHLCYLAPPCRSTDDMSGLLVPLRHHPLPTMLLLQPMRLCLPHPPFWFPDLVR